MIHQLTAQDVQTRLAMASGEWLRIDSAGRITVDLTRLAKIAHDVGCEMIDRGARRELAHRYRLLAGAMRISAQSPTLQSPQVGVVVSRWATALERQALWHEQSHGVGR